MTHDVPNGYVTQDRFAEMLGCTTSNLSKRSLGEAVFEKIGAIKIGNQSARGRHAKVCFPCVEAEIAERFVHLGYPAITSCKMAADMVDIADVLGF